MTMKNKLSILVLTVLLSGGVNAQSWFGGSYSTSYAVGDMKDYMSRPSWTGFPDFLPAATASVSTASPVCSIVSAGRRMRYRRSFMSPEQEWAPIFFAASC